MWAGETVDYKCEYPRDFNIDDVADCLAQAQQAFDLGITSKTFSLEVAKKVLESYMPNIDPDIYDAIINELQAAANDLEQSTAYGSELDDDQSND